MNEASKVLPVIRDLLGEPYQKTILDLGCGTEKIVPWAHGVDNRSENPNAVCDQLGDVEQIVLNNKICSWDVVFSSHTLEHCTKPILEVLRFWWEYLKIGGLLVLWLPDERYYQFHPADPHQRNPAHKHYLTMDIIWWAIRQIPNLQIKRLELYPLLYSFLIVAERTY